MVKNIFIKKGFNSFMWQYSHSLDEQEDRGSAVILCLGILGLAMAIGLAFLYSSRQHSSLANAQADIIKVRLLAESGLERTLAGMEEMWQPQNDSTWFNFTAEDLEALEEKLSGEFYPNDEKDGSSVDVRILYHGGKIDPNWFGNDGSVGSAAIGFSPIGHAFSSTDNSKELFVEREDMIPSGDNLWFSRAQIYHSLDDTLTEAKFTSEGVNDDVFFPFSPRDSSSPKAEDSDKDEPYLVVRTDGRTCDCSDSDSYEAIFHKNFCEKYGPIDSETGKHRCVYFGGCNTFVDREVAQYKDGKLINPQVAIKRRVPFYCLRYIRGERHGGGPISLRQPNQIKFVGPKHSVSSGLNYSYDEVPEYLRDQKLIDCVPWFRKIQALEEYGSSGTDTVGNSLARFWQLISNFTRYCGPNGLGVHQLAVCVYDSNVNGWPYCGRRAGALFSKLRFRLVKDGDSRFRVELQPETVNFYLQAEDEGNRTYAKIAGHDFMLGTVVRAEVNGVDTNMSLASQPTVKTSQGTINSSWPVVKLNPVLTTNTIKIKSINLNTLSSNTATYSYWGSPIRIDFEDGLELSIADDETEGEWGIVLECIDPIANNFGDAWVTSKTDWGEPNKTWDETNGAYTEGKLTNPIGGNLKYIPASTYVRGTFPSDSLSGFSGVTENSPSYVKTLWEIGCISRAKPGQTIDLLDKDKELLDQFCLFPGDDYDSFLISKKVYSSNDNEKDFEELLTESGKVNPNGLSTLGINSLVKNLNRQAETTSPSDAYGYPMNAKNKFGNVSLPVANYGTRSAAAVAIANSYTGSTREKEELAGKMAQLMQVRYQYFEVVITATTRKRISTIDGGGTRQTGNSYMVAVVERDAFTGAIRTLTKREYSRELKQ